MTGKILLLILLTAAGGFGGVCVGKRSVRRRQYFEQIITLINSLISDFSFRQSNVCEILRSMELPALSVHIEEFCAYASGGNELKLSRLDLKDREYSSVYELFSALGTYDLTTQVYVLENYKTKMNEFYVECREKEKKSASTCVKLGALLGLACGVMIL